MSPLFFIYKKGKDDFFCFFVEKIRVFLLFSNSSIPNIAVQALFRFSVSDQFCPFIWVISDFRAQIRLNNLVWILKWATRKLCISIFCWSFSGTSNWYLQKEKEKVGYGVQIGIRSTILLNCRIRRPKKPLIRYVIRFSKWHQYCSSFERIREPNRCSTKNSIEFLKLPIQKTLCWCYVQFHRGSQICPFKGRNIKIGPPIL